MIDGPDAARQPEPLGRVHSHGGIENDAFRYDGAVNKALLEFEPRVGDAGPSVELSSRECRWHSDLADFGCREVRDLSLAVCDDGAEGLHPIDIHHAVLEADGDGFASIGHRTAAEGDEEVGAGRPRRIGTGDHCVTGGVSGHVIVHASEAGPERPAHLLDLVSISVELHRRAGQERHRHQHGRKRSLA